MLRGEIVLVDCNRGEGNGDKLGCVVKKQLVEIGALPTQTTIVGWETAPVNHTKCLGAAGAGLISVMVDRQRHTG